MGETFAEVVLRANGKQAKKRLLVDTGATFSWISAETLKALAVEPVDEEVYETIEGRIVRRKIGFIEMECLGRRAPAGVLFARKTDSEVLGLHALEGLRLEVDPHRNRIKPSKTIKAWAAKEDSGTRRKQVHLE